jgi:hypothetical protein
MADVLTLEEMRRRYDGEWVMIAYTSMFKFSIIRQMVR